MFASPHTTAQTSVSVSRQKPLPSLSPPQLQTCLEEVLRPGVGLHPEDVLALGVVVGDLDPALGQLDGRRLLLARVRMLNETDDMKYSRLSTGGRGRASSAVLALFLLFLAMPVNGRAGGAGGESAKAAAVH